MTQTQSNPDHAAALRFNDYISTRLTSIGLLPSLREILLDLAREDSLTFVQRNSDVWEFVIEWCGTDAHTVAPFHAGWLGLYMAATHLDHIQDNDLLTPRLATMGTSLQYTVVLAYYVLSSSILDMLDTTAIPENRIIRLHQLWSDSVLRIASGQHSDLTDLAPEALTNILDHYQQIVHAKTGEFFALAFGGIAALTSDDINWTAAMLAIGGLFGDLVQYQDDLLDLPMQQNDAITFHRALAQTHRTSDAPDVYTMWQQTRHAYLTAVQSLVQGTYPNLEDKIMYLFTRFFGD